MAGKNGSRGDEEGKTGLITKTRPKTKKPNLYKVLLLNDDYTPMEFVVHVLERFFNKGREDATRIMLHVHQQGRRHLRRLHLRGGRDQGRPGDGYRPPAPAPAAVHHGKGLRGPPLPSFSRNLEESLHRAVAYANQRKHEYATLEHLLLSLIDDADAAGVMRACDSVCRRR